MVTTTLQLGISILNGGNSEVQRVCVLNFSKRNPLDYDIITLNLLLEPLFVLYSFCFFQKMLEYLKDKKDVGFFLSVQALMQTCRSFFNQIIL